jgi:hypothetical protein
VSNADNAQIMTLIRSEIKRLAEATDVMFPQLSSLNQTPDIDESSATVNTTSETTKLLNDGNLVPVPTVNTVNVNSVNSNQLYAVDDICIPGTYEEIYAISNKNKLRGKENKRRHSHSSQASGSTAATGTTGATLGSGVLLHPVINAQEVKGNSRSNSSVGMSTDDEDGPVDEVKQQSSPEADAIVSSIFRKNDMFADATTSSTVRIVCH